MATTVEFALKQYIDLIRALVAHAKSATETSLDTHLRRSADQHFFSLVEAAESQPEFYSLVEKTRDEFSADSFERIVSGIWTRPVQSFFRQSGYYRQVFEGETIDDSTLTVSYHEALRRRTHQVTYLAPLEFIEFGQDVLDFGNFKICRFSEAGLERLLKQEVRKVFYPTTVVDSHQLSEYWFVVASETLPTGPFSDMEISAGPEITLQYSSFPRALEKIFRRLVLYRFPNSLSGPPRLVGGMKGIDPWVGFFRFGVPFFFRISDAMTESPGIAPDVSILAMKPDSVGGPNEPPIEVWRPVVEYSMDSPEIEEFLCFVKNVNSLLDEIEPSFLQWRFIDVAMSFLVKAFFADLSSGPEQLLWHIVAIEAVLGEDKGRGVTERLKKRVSALLARSDDGTQKIPNEFLELYRLRSQIVHGSTKLETSKVLFGHLGQAREIARRVVHWMLCYLAHVHKTCSGRTVGMPEREEILLTLDVDNPGRARLTTLLATLPSGFPRVPNW